MTIEEETRAEIKRLRERVKTLEEKEGPESAIQKLEAKIKALEEKIEAQGSGSIIDWDA